VVSHLHLVLHILLIMRGIYSCLLLLNIIINYILDFKFRFSSGKKLFSLDYSCSTTSCLNISSLRVWITTFSWGECSIKVSVVQTASPCWFLGGSLLCPKSHYLLLSAVLILEFAAPINLLSKSKSLGSGSILVTRRSAALKLNSLVNIHIRVMVQFWTYSTLCIKLKV
jgi:hypothetical protein